MCGQILDLDIRGMVIPTEKRLYFIVLFFKAYETSCKWPQPVM